ncbi:MAG: MTAP family purine nucleoside phosphorylase, partial [Fimbriimonadaceae bacterium]|nr:MTAP family purine nucleoside phosphorylase [Fimbriimonadaceae bacterium]
CGAVEADRMGHPFHSEPTGPGGMLAGMKADAAIIGGTGIGSRLAELGRRSLCIPTPFGDLRGRLLEYEDRRLVLVERHAAGHRLPPHHVPYAAMGWGLAALGVRVCLSSAAVGSLRPDWPPGTLAACDSFLDLTGRQITRFSHQVQHTAMNRAMEAGRHLREAANELGEGIHDHAIYVGMDGPRYESTAEIEMLRRLGGDVVGMTASSEAVAMAESGIMYGCLAVVTNLGAGLSAMEPEHGEVAELMTVRGSLVVRILLKAADRALDRLSGPPDSED